MNQVRYFQKTVLTDKQGKIPVYLIFHYSGTQLEYYTKEKCAPSDWDADKMKFRRSLPGYQEANERLQVLTDRLRKAYRDTINADEPVTNDLLRIALRGNAHNVPKSVDLYTLYVAYLESRKAELKASTYKSMNNTAVRLKRYEKALGGMRVTHYTQDVHQDLVSAMLADMEPTSVGVVCKHLITFFSYCRNTLNIKLHTRHAQIKKESSAKERIYLTDSDLLKLEMATLATTLDKVRDAFLFQCYTGLRYQDLWRLKNHHIEQRDGYRVLCLLTEKSVSRLGKIKRVEVPLLPAAERILSRYDAASLRLLPILSNQKMNDGIKQVAEQAGLTDLVECVEYRAGIPSIVAVEKWKLCSSHIARHTWATQSLIKGVPLEVVSKTLGHSSMNTTKLYAKVVDEWKNKVILSAWASSPPQTSPVSAHALE